MNITSPGQLKIKPIADRLGIRLYFGKTNMRFYNYIVIQKSNAQKEWQDFGHEVTHHLIHAGNQIYMHPLFKQLQEYQANYFAYHFCAPTFMINDLSEVSPHILATHFCLEHEFAWQRFRMYQNKLYDERKRYYVL
ncbi:hypothetical protein HNR44_001729 [Geomicrobium halophilum]|uniref:IrrE N-terminal-like domain-containing protein n=1 Tax=Geomicrobium halophilum TaxID=549000 RepID=A0A841PTX1_9BACL|nr:ImmA/IrrE family metallo-endopeptidase [Geomicrobium halophilum]MBB6449751.1 hypothetical protein [Geomicrobium halophilum]